MGVNVKAGVLKIGTPLCIPDKEVSIFIIKFNRLWHAIIQKVLFNLILTNIHDLFFSNIFYYLILSSKTFCLSNFNSILSMPKM